MNKNSNIIEVKWEQIFTNYSDFETLIITPLKANFPKYEFLNEDNASYTFNQIFLYFNSAYIGRSLRYSITIFIAKFETLFIEKLSTFYLKTIAWKNQELIILKNVKDRDRYNNQKSTSTSTNQHVETGEGFGGNAEPIDNKSNASFKSKDSSIGINSNDSDDYDIVDNLERIMTAKFRFGIKELVGEFNYLFNIYEKIDITNILNF